MATAGEVQIHPGSTLGKCYKVEKLLGEGTFGYAVKCRKIETNEVVAIKVNKNHPITFHQARGEIATLKKLRCLDPDTCNIVKWNGFFFDKDHICLNFELLDQSLRDYVQCRYKKALTMTELRSVIKQLATTLSHLSSMELVHADIKPENIMVVDRLQQPLKVKLIDFGLAHPVSDVDSGVCVQTVWYRAPEVMLQIPYNEAIDMWSLGLVAAELAIGRPLYAGYTDYDMLCCISETQGQPPDHVLDCGLTTNSFFNHQRNRKQRWILKTPEETEAELVSSPRQRLFPVPKCLDDLEEMMVNNREDRQDRRLLMDLIRKMLHLDPEQRIKPMEVLQHPFITQSFPESSNHNTSTGTEDHQETPEVFQFHRTAGPNSNHSSVQNGSSRVDLENFPPSSTSIHEQSETSDEIAAPDELEVLQQNLSESANPDSSLEMAESPGVIWDDLIIGPNRSDTSSEIATEDQIQVVAGSKMGECHKMISALGEGGFGVVIKCLNTETNEVVAIKAIKNNPENDPMIRQEISILERLRSLDLDTSSMVKWNGSFSYKDYTCLSFELLNKNLDDYLLDRRYEGLTTRELRPLIHQLATALHHLSSLEVLHHDIKPNNIMIVNPQQQPLKVKLIDFGLACPVSDVELGSLIGTIGYMAPEVLLQIPYNEAIDMWSLGLVVVELAIGHPLYNVTGVYDMLRLIIKTQGQPPDHMLESGMATEYFYNRHSNSQQCWTLKTPEQFMSETGEETMDECVPRVRCLDDLERLMANNEEDKRDRRLLMDLIKKMLHLDPEQRIKPQEVLQHPFITQSLPQGSKVKKGGLFRRLFGMFQKEVLQHPFMTQSLPQGSKVKKGGIFRRFFGISRKKKRDGC